MQDESARYTYYMMRTARYLPTERTLRTKEASAGGQKNGWQQTYIQRARIELILKVRSRTNSSQAKPLLVAFDSLGSHMPLTDRKTSSRRPVKSAGRISDSAGDTMLLWSRPEIMLSGGISCGLSRRS